MKKVNLICCEIRSSEFILKVTEFYFSTLASWAFCFQLIHLKCPIQLAYGMVNYFFM